MPNYKFIEKMTVLQHPLSKNIVRLMIEHDGEQNYGLQRSIVTKGVARHFYNKKIWHSLYNIKLEHDRRVDDYEAKGFDVMTEIYLCQNQQTFCPELVITNDEPTSNLPLIDIDIKDIPLSIISNFNAISITDLRYGSEYLDVETKRFFEEMRHAIEYLPFSMVAIKKGTKFIVTKLVFNSRPMPKNDMLYLRMIVSKNKSSRMQLIDTSPNNVEYVKGRSYASYSGNILTFYTGSQWQTLNLFVEVSQTGLCSFYALDNERFELVYQGQSPNIPRTGNVKVLAACSDKILDIIYVSTLGYHEELTKLESISSKIF